MASNLYELLEIPKDAAPEQSASSCITILCSWHVIDTGATKVRKAYKKKALQTHPDRLPPGSTPADKASSEEKFRKVSTPHYVKSLTILRPVIRLIMPTRY